MISYTTESPWVSTSLPTYAALATELHVDICVVGGGLCGITTAYLLQKEGVRVALLERDTLACGDTARTTAHVTYVTDTRLHRLHDQLGADAARAFWQAGETAIDQIEALSREVHASFGFQRTEGYLHANHLDDRSDVSGLREDARLAQLLGFDAQYVERIPLMSAPGVRFADQARFHPRKYLDVLVRAFVAAGGQVFEHTAAQSVQESPLQVSANGHQVHCDYVVLATHNPIMGEQGMLASALFQSKLALYTSYAIGARVPNTMTEALYWDTCDPYNYLRVEKRDADVYAIFGGGDVKTGQESDRAAIFEGLQHRLSQILPNAHVDARWTGQVIETDDGLPFIGENAARQFIATGFSGNGITLGTVGAMMARDHYLGRENPWRDLFRVDRTIFHGGMWNYAKENKDFPYYFLRDRLLGSSRRSLASLTAGEGCVLTHHGRPVAAYRNEQGKLSVCSAVCTHMKCLVRWNVLDKTWDCPCHGSRFRPGGEVIGGPAEQPLEKLSADAS